MTMRLITTAFGCAIFAGRCGYTTSSLATSNCINNNSYTISEVYGPDGSSYNICVFSNESACEEWMFLRNECSTTNPIFAGYCANSGGELSLEETVDGSGEYEVCTLNGVQCSDFDYYELNKCPFTSNSVDDDSLCVASGGTSRPMGTRRTASSVDGSEYFLCYFGSDNACEMGKLMSGECDENTPNLISFCADNGGMMSLGGVEPHEYEVCKLADGIKCIEEHYYLHNNCTTTKEVDPTEISPDNDSCSSATVISAVPFEQEGTVADATADVWTTDPSCNNFKQVSPGNGVWYIIEGVKTGRKQILLTCSFMECMLLSSNSTLGDCPSTFLCADAWVGRGEYDAITYTLTTEADGIYYVYIAPTDENPGPGFRLSVDEVPSPTPVPTSTRDSIPVNGADAPWLVLRSLIHIVMFTIVYCTVV